MEVAALTGSFGKQRSFPKREERVQKSDWRRQGSSGQRQGNEYHQSVQPCRNCGIRSHKYGVCPAKGKSCMKCGKEGHFARMCRQRQASSIAAVKIDDDQQPEVVEEKVNIFD